MCSAPDLIVSLQVTTLMLQSSRGGMQQMRSTIQ
jgi:hypothetical protein